tara:strand:+ start:42 stop:611 length:570 start_codon:yes stop_codon:yes gene_type:complete
VTDFSTSKYGPVFETLIDTSRIVAIDEGSANHDLYTALQAANINNGFTNAVVDQDFAAGCISAVWLWNDFLDESHTISQEVHTTTGSFWHGIMHRRECDYSNSKYWFRKVGYHEVFDLIAQQAVALAGGVDKYNLLDAGNWDPFGFVDLCQQAGRGNKSLLTYCQAVTRVEWELLFDYCYSRAIGESIS